MIKLTRIFIVSLLVLSCSKKVKYIDREININVVPLPKKVEVVESNKYIFLPKKVKVFIDSDETKRKEDNYVTTNKTIVAVAKPPACFVLTKRFHLNMTVY